MQSNKFGNNALVCQVFGEFDNSCQSEREHEKFRSVNTEYGKTILDLVCRIRGLESWPDRCHEARPKPYQLPVHARMTLVLPMAKWPVWNSCKTSQNRSFLASCGQNNIRSTPYQSDDASISPYRMLVSLRKGHYLLRPSRYSTQYDRKTYILLYCTVKAKPSNCVGVVR